MEIQQLRHLMAAVEHRNLLKAADKTFISQSGLSRSIKSLEHRLGVPLLIRGPKGVEPTVYGQSVLRRAKVILNEVAKSIQEVRAIEQARVGEVTFGITPNYATYLVPQLLAALHRDRPGLRVTVITDGFVELIERVKSESIDFAFGLIGQVRRSDGIVIETIRAHRARVMAAADHPLARAGVCTSEDLARAEWAMLNGEGVQRSFGLFFENRGLPVPAQVMRSNSISLVRQMVKDSNVLSILPEEVVHADIEAGEIVALECETPVEQTRVGLFFREGGLLTPQAELVIDRFRRAASPIEEAVAA
ncbi:LysR family transcriptional regulator [Novosphingobium sp. Gsoil 351]|uniref:LysR family transcriptional regulator n=1 Tax=Novosphingobium sp. Gsoil 351 TaxID=2675225 RepID=UPI0012B4BB2F|nr:LysR family transcriptional regulator [Novosphingobium sp. Gsoil 351]QGN55876.1 LysR family transcriptional regulator [Novosphingobium sp. Gsoil 351]